MQQFSALLKAAQAGDRGAIESVVRLVEQDVRAVCFDFQMQGNGQLSRNDLFQEAWMKIWIRLDQFEIRGKDDLVWVIFRKWARTTARNVMYNVLEQQQAAKRKHSRPLTTLDRNEVDGPAETPSRNLIARENATRISQAIEQLPEESRILIQKCFINGNSVKDVTRQLNWTYETTRYRLSKAISMLRQLLTDSNF